MPVQPPGLDIGMLLRTLWRRFPIVLAMAVVGTGLGVMVQRSVKPRYTSSESLILEPKRSDSFGSDTIFGGSMYVDGAKIASVLSIIQSSDLLARVVATEHLDAVPEFGDLPPSRLKKWFGFLPFTHAPVVNENPKERVARAIGQLERSLHVDRLGLTYVITIDADATRPELAQRVATAVADAYLSDLVERKTTTTQRDSVWLSDRLTSVRHDLERSEAALDAVRRKYGLLETDLSSGATLDRQAITDLNRQYIQAQADTSRLRVRYEQLLHAQQSRTGALADLPEIAASAMIQQLRSKQSEDQKDLASFRAVYGDNYPQVRRLRESSHVLQTQIDAEAARIVESYRAEYEAAEARAQELHDQLQQSIAAQGTGSTGDEGHEQLRNTQRLVEANRGLYDALLTKWREVQQQQTREEPEARVISQATLPDRPSYPKPLMFPAAGGMAFLFMGLGLTLLPALLDTRLASAKAIEQALRLPVLGAIPLLQRRDLRGGARRGFNRRRSIVDFPNHRPLSRFAESLRMVRTFLHISSDGPSVVLQVTSAVSGEGKSTAAASLAVSAALAGIRTVLVDVDLRTSSLSAMFGLKDRPGLTDALDQGIPVQTLLHEREAMGLAVLGSGSALLPRPDLIDSPRFAIVLRELSETYGLVILDSPPVLPVSDALIVSRQADATVLVVQWRGTTRQVAGQAVKLLRSVGAPLAGVMLNKIDLSKVPRDERGYADYAGYDVARRPARKKLGQTLLAATKINMSGIKQ